MNRLRTLWWAISGSLWFLPSLVVLSALVLAVVLVEFESLFQLELARKWPRLFGAGADGAGSMLSAIATSMMTVAGVVFSVTLVALTLAASQYSPRVIRTFMADRPTQAVLGVFVAVFAYCLLVLRTIRSDDTGEPFVPSLAVFGAMVLALVAVGFLVFYIHHLAVAIQASSILARLAEATSKVADELFPSNCPAAQEPDAPGERTEAAVSSWIAVRASTSGYIVSVDHERLLQIAERMERIVRVEQATGEFVVAGQTIVSVSAGPPLSQAEETSIEACYGQDRVRNIEQDLEFGIQQIVDIALKALSPGINDQTTAIMCIDRLAEVMARIADRRICYKYRRVDDSVRLIVANPTFERLLGLAFAQVLHHGATYPAVVGRIQWALQRVMEAAREPSRLGAVAGVTNSVTVAQQRAR